MSKNTDMIINKLIWIDAKVNNSENKGYQNLLKKKYNLQIQAFEDAKLGINELAKIYFESIFVITSGSIYPEFFAYMKKTYEELRVVPFSIIFTSSTKSFIKKHENDEIGKIYNKTFFNRGGVVDRFEGVLSFIEDIFTNLNNFKTCNKYAGIYTKNYTGHIVFKNFNDPSPLPPFYKDIYQNKTIDFGLLNDFTKFFLVNFCTKNIEKLLKPLILFKEVPEVIISKWWARTYTHESPFYSVMNKSLMKSEYKDYESYIKLLYRGLACNSYRPVYFSKLVRGTKLDLSEINYLKSIAGTDTIIFNKCFLSFSVNKKVEKSSNEDEKKVNLNAFKIAIAFQSNCVRDDDKKNVDEDEDEDEDEKDTGNCKSKKPKDDKCFIANPPKKSLQNEKEVKSDAKEEKESLNVLIEISNINENDINNYIISNAYLKEISYYSKEEEVLVFPFTGFEIERWDNYSFEQKNGKIKGTIFYFKFSKNYKKLIKEKYD